MSLKTAIVKKEAQLKHKEEMGEELKFIDFHQLQIENKKQIQQIDERNAKLKSLKDSSSDIKKVLDELKHNLKVAETE